MTVLFSTNSGIRENLLLPELAAIPV